MARLPNFLVIIRSEKLSGKGQGRGGRGAKKRTFRFGKKNVSFPKVETFRFADYIRLGYDFKKKLLKKVDWLTRLELTVSGQNLLTVSPATEYGMDPENASNQNYSYPMERTFAFGVNVGF